MRIIILISFLLIFFSSYSQENPFINDTIILILNNPLSNNDSISGPIANIIDTNTIDTNIIDTIRTYQLEIPVIEDTSTTYGNMIREIRDDTMILGKTLTIRLSILKDISPEYIIKLKGFKDETQPEKIQIDRKMTTILLFNEKDVIVNQICDITQPIEDRKSTDWKWIIKPKNPGNIKVYLYVSVINSENINKTIIDKTYSIFVIDNKTTLDKIFIFLSEYWQFLIGTILIPILFFIWKLKTTKNN